MKTLSKNLLIWAAVLAALFLVLSRINPMKDMESRESTLAYSEFVKAVKQKAINSIDISGSKIDFQSAGGEHFVTYNPGDPHLIDDLLDNGVQIKTEPPQQQSMLMSVFISWFPMLLLIAVWVIYCLIA